MYLTHPIQLTSYGYGSVFQTDYEYSANNKSPEEIIAIIARYFNVSETDLRSSSRKVEFVSARHFCMSYLYSMCPRLSLLQIGKMFGGRDHTTVMHAKAKVRDRVSSKSDDIYKLYEQDISSMLKISFYDHIYTCRMRAPLKAKTKIKQKSFYKKKLDPALLKETLGKKAVVVDMPRHIDRKSFTTYSNASPYKIASPGI